VFIFSIQTFHSTLQRFRAISSRFTHKPLTESPEKYPSKVKKRIPWSSNLKKTMVINYHFIHEKCVGCDRFLMVKGIFNLHLKGIPFHSFISSQILFIMDCNDIIKTNTSKKSINSTEHKVYIHIYIYILFIFKFQILYAIGYWMDN
jgi:hypothetical protein